MEIYHVWDICENDSSLFGTFEKEENAKKWIKQKGEEYNENEANGDLNDLFHEYSHSNTKQTFESFVVNAKGYKLIKL